MKTRNLAVVVLSMAFLGIPATTQAFVSKFKVSPSHPYVDDSDVTVSWTADRNLRAGTHYEGNLVDEPGFACASFVTVDSKRVPKKGKVMRLTFSSFNDLINGGPEWCDGKATVAVNVVKNGTNKGNTFVGIVGFRFIRKP